MPGDPGEEDNPRGTQKGIHPLERIKGAHLQAGSAERAERAQAERVEEKVMLMEEPGVLARAREALDLERVGERVERVVARSRQPVEKSEEEKEIGVSPRPGASARAS